MKTSDEGMNRALALAVLVLAAVATTAPAAGAGAATTNKVVVSATSIGRLGKILVSNGTALYTLRPSATACDAQCLKIWPPVTLPAQVKSATVGPGVSHSALGVTSGTGGIRQVTYHGRALFWYSGDTRGHVDGNLTDAWGTWTAVIVGRQGATGTSSPASGGSTAGSGGASF